MPEPLKGWWRCPWIGWLWIKPFAASKGGKFYVVFKLRRRAEFRLRGWRKLAWSYKQFLANWAMLRIVLRWVVGVG
jgi:hypothetical protein